MLYITEVLKSNGKPLNIVINDNFIKSYNLGAKTGKKLKKIINRNKDK